jgi:hypothetical protein
MLPSQTTKPPHVSFREYERTVRKRSFSWTRYRYASDVASSKRAGYGISAHISPTLAGSLRRGDEALLVQVHRFFPATPQSELLSTLNFLPCLTWLFSDSLPI